jgi:hypothetical protein
LSLAYGGTNYTALNNRGSVLVGLGKFEEAIKDFNTAIDVEPESSSAYLDHNDVVYCLVIY